jgi:hypothetical protein
VGHFGASTSIEAAAVIKVKRVAHPEGGRRHYRLMGLTTLALVAAAGSGAWTLRTSGRSAPLRTIAVQSPVASTLSWLSAIEDQNKPMALAHFVPADRQMMEWSSWGPPFTHTHCSLEARDGTNAVVYCIFDDINDAGIGMSNVSWWSVSLQREPSGRWLINNYGQG